MIAIRLDEGLLVRVDRERRRRRITRARAVHEALADWVARHRLAEAVREEAEAYARQPVTDDEFGPVLGAQRWPKLRADLHHVATVPRAGLRAYVGTVPGEVMQRVCDALLFALGFAGPKGE